MKTYILYIIIFLFVLASCTDTNKSIKKTDLIGDWKIENVEFKSNDKEKKLKEIAKMRRQGSGNIFYYAEKGDFIKFQEGKVIYENNEYLEGEWKIVDGDRLNFDLLSKNKLKIIGFENFAEHHKMKIELSKENDVLTLRESLGLGDVVIRLKK